jgi:hypothetical protein
MTPTHTATGRQYRMLVPAAAETVPRTPAQPAPPPQDPPIYRDLVRAWAKGGRTLPGRHDPEWVRLAAPLVRPGQFSAATRDPRGDGR